MVAGVNKVISYDPPGAIGLVDRSAIFLIRFGETEDATRPQDELGSCGDFDGVIDGTDMPAMVDGVIGRARQFDGAAAGLAARDLEPGATLLTRDASIQAILSWDAEAQDAAGNPGVIIARGRGNTGAEYTAYELRIDVADAPSFVGRLRWVWQDLAGGVHEQPGGTVVIRPGTFTMVTATRRWVSPTEVVIRYYIGDELAAEFTTTDGEIGGGTTGAMQLGYRSDGAAGEQFFAGVLDEVMVLDRELCREEIEATWLRITKYQPLGERMLRELVDKGFPISDDPYSDAQRELRMVGQLLGYQAALAENLRANFLPGRSYGRTLEQWEEAVSVTAAPATDIDQRRARVLARLRQRRGISIPGMGDALVDLLGAALVGELEFLAFDNTIREDFDGDAPDPLNLMRWDTTPALSWSLSSDTAVCTPAAGSYIFDARINRAWQYARMSVGGDAQEAHLLAAVGMTTPQSGLEVGLFFSGDVEGNHLLFGLRDVAGVFSLVSESFVDRISQGVVTHVVLGANPPLLALHLWQTATPGAWRCAWSTTSTSFGFTTGTNITHPTAAQWGGIYMRTTGAIAGAGEVTVDSLVMRQPYATRPYNAYVLLDRALGVAPDVAGARSIVDAIRHGYTHATFITSRNLLCDDADSGCDLAPMGAL